jgi:hypothetical protein
MAGCWGGCGTGATRCGGGGSQASAGEWGSGLFLAAWIVRPVDNGTLPTIVWFEAPPSQHDANKLGLKRLFGLRPAPALPTMVEPIIWRSSQPPTICQWVGWESELVIKILAWIWKFGINPNGRPHPQSTPKIWLGSIRLPSKQARNDKSAEMLSTLTEHYCICLICLLLVQHHCVPGQSWWHDIPWLAYPSTASFHLERLSIIL